MLKYFILFFAVTCTKCSSPPHIVLIVGDDMGWNDVGHHGSSQIPTPNIDALGYNGILFKKHYTMHICTPSRSALLTGKYPIRTGMQGFPLSAGEPRALPLNVPLISEKISGLGYSAYLIGKWHLGHQFRNVTPLGRGFESYLGYWNGFCGYFDYEIQDQPLGANGFDLHRGHNPAYEYAHTTYATDLFTNEAINVITNHNKSKPMFLFLSHLAAHSGKNGLLEVKDKEEVNKKYNYIKSPNRRLYADIVEGLDTSVGQVVKSLEANGMLENSIIIFMSDNGAQTFGLYENFGSNWPFRGLKFTLFEGAVRNTAVIWSKLLKNKKYVENNLFHITDWFPTLYAAAGGDTSNLGTLDGINQWSLLSEGTSNTNRPNLLLNIDEVKKYSAIMTADGRYKLTQGSYEFGIYDSHSGDSGRSFADPAYNISAILSSDVNTAISKVDNTAIPLTDTDIIKLRSELDIGKDISALNIAQGFLACKLFNGYCLFDLQEDPREMKDIKNENPEIFNNLKATLTKYKSELMPQTNKNVDKASNPKHCNNTWFTWGETDPKLKCANYVVNPPIFSIYTK